MSERQCKHGGYAHACPICISADRYRYRTALERIRDARIWNEQGIFRCNACGLSGEHDPVIPCGIAAEALRDPAAKPDKAPG